MSDDSHDHVMGYGVVIATTDKALLVKLTDQHADQQFWVPRSVIHDNK